MLSVVYYYSDTFRYLARLLVVLEGVSFRDVGTMGARFAMWERMWNVFLEDPSSLKWLIGLGSRPEFSVGDNDVFYTIWHYGLIGIFLHLMVYLTSLDILRKTQNLRYKALGMTSLFLLFILGFVVETMADWFLPLVVFYIIGLSVGIRGNHTSYYAIHFK